MVLRVEIRSFGLINKIPEFLRVLVAIRAFGSDFTSTPNGLTDFIATATLPELKPPARKIGISR
jgi:hypothetical protein